MHIVEIDLLRSGERPPFVTPLPESPYFVSVSRAENRPRVDIWPVSMTEPIPVVAVPLLVPDPDVPLDLSLAVRTIYDRAGYDLRIDYAKPPVPPLLPEEAVWLR